MVATQPLGARLPLTISLTALALARLLGGDRAGLDHVVDDVVAAVRPPAGGRSACVGSKSDGAFTMPASIAASSIGEVLGLLGEVDLARGEDAVGAVAERRDVEVALEDLVLAQLLVDLERVAHLAELALAGVLGRGDDVLRVGRRVGDGQADELHGERRGALLGLAGLVVGDERAGDALDVDAVVLVEVVVLGGDHGLLHDLGATSLSGTSRRFSSYIVASGVLPSVA